MITLPTLLVIILVVVLVGYLFRRPALGWGYYGDGFALALIVLIILILYGRIP